MKSLKKKTNKKGQKIKIVKKKKKVVLKNEKDCLKTVIIV
jgi:hypothetical protein